MESLSHRAIDENNFLFLQSFIDQITRSLNDSITTIVQWLNAPHFSAPTHVDPVQPFKS
jgi:hypothetical protein